MKIKIIITIAVFIAFVGSTIWITEGLTLKPQDKFLICWIGGIIIGGGLAFPTKKQ